ncbi:30S ribosomal protein S18 [Patulibacter defluvii]|uniref:30S ribosomal protein S18 n=1 Tax=Patulibacter defluvii TaxID=3095358 RepID=UPI0035C936C0
MARPSRSPRGRRSPKGGTRRAPKLTKEQIAQIDHLHVDALRLLVTEKGKIRSRRATGLNARDQAHAARAVKQARELALLPYPHPRMIAMPGREDRGEERPERGGRGGGRGRDRDE